MIVMLPIPRWFLPDAPAWLRRLGFYLCCAGLVLALVEVLRRMP